MNDRQPADSYDVAILGGGLAGLTLAIQLKRERPETSIFGSGPQLQPPCRTTRSTQRRIVTSATRASEAQFFETAGASLH